MSIFAKKSESEQVSRLDGSGRGRAYGIAEAIQLLRSLPTDQNTDLIVRVMRTTLESLGVHLPDIIDDATRKETLTQERIAALHDQFAEIEKQLAALRHEIATLEADLEETTSVKERLQMAEKAAGGAHAFAARAEGTHTLPYSQHPPPLPAVVRPPTKLSGSPRDAGGEKE